MHHQVLEPLATRTVLWAAGVQASPLGKVLSTATGAKLDRQGRVVVEAPALFEHHPVPVVESPRSRFQCSGQLVFAVRADVDEAPFD